MSARRWTAKLDMAELRRLNQAYRLDQDGTKRRECNYIGQRWATFGGPHNLTARQMRRIVKKARHFAAHHGVTPSVVAGGGADTTRDGAQ